VTTPAIVSTTAEKLVLRGVKPFVMVNPNTAGKEATGRQLADAADVDLAVAAAKRALPGWAEMRADARAGILHRATDLIVERTAAIADRLTREQGKPIPDAQKEIRFGVDVIRYYAEEGRRLGGAIRASSRMDIRSLPFASR
jgi:succinate-semialdehyde dehydrogenase/glutarate-semialdehyde dehydrogenase